MGWLQGLRLASDISTPAMPAGVGISSPWSEGGNLLPALVADELLGLGAPTYVTRSMALKVPAIAKGRAILHAIISAAPLRALRGDELLDPQPAWLTRTDSGISPQLRTRLILDDLIFENSSLLVVKRGFDGGILDAAPVPWDDWNVTPDGEIAIHGTPVPADSVVYIPGPGPGLLEMAAAHIVGAISTDKAWAERVRNPFPAMVIQEREEYGMTADEARAYVKEVAAARRKPDSAVMFMPSHLEIQSHQAENLELFESGRNALRLDFANFLNLPASLLDGSTSTASLTYSTQEGRRNELFDYTIRYWASPIEEALSLDNVVPRGQRVRFDFASYLTTEAAPTGPTLED